MNPGLTNLWVLLAAVVIAAVAVGCSSNQYRSVVEPICRAEAFPPPLDGVQPCSAPEVLHAAVSTIYALDPILGRDTRATLDAAGPLLRTAFAAQARVGVSMWAPITPGQWQSWVEEKTAVSSEVAVHTDDHPPDTATSVSRVLSVTITPTGQAPIAFRVYARATRHGSESAWLLAELQVMS